MAAAEEKLAVMKAKALAASKALNAHEKEAGVTLNLSCLSVQSRIDVHHSGMSNREPRKAARSLRKRPPRRLQKRSLWMVLKSRSRSHQLLRR